MVSDAEFSILAGTDHVEEIQTQDTDFKATDHHLVKLTITFS